MIERVRLPRIGPRRAAQRWKREREPGHSSRSRIRGRSRRRRGSSCGGERDDLADHFHLKSPRNLAYELEPPFLRIAATRISGALFSQGGKFKISLFGGDVPHWARGVPENDLARSFIPCVSYNIIK